MRTGERVIVTANAGMVAGEVIDVRDVLELPLLTGLEMISSESLHILHEEGIRRVAIIEHPYFFHDSTEAQALRFAALEDDAGNWCDLKGQRLTITPLNLKAPRPPKQQRTRRRHAHARPSAT